MCNYFTPAAISCFSGLIPKVKLLFLVDNFKAVISLQPFNYFLINTISKVFKQMKSPSDLI